MVTPGGFIARKENDAKTIDNLVTNFGGCGPFQIRLVIATYSAQLCAVWGMMFMVFGNYHPDYHCLDNTTYLLNGSSIDNSTLDDWTIDELTRWNLDQYDLDVNGSEDNNTDVSYCRVMESCQDVGFDGISQTVATEWRLLCKDEWVQSFIIGVQMVGVLLGAHYGAFVGDKCGRRLNLYINVAFHTIFNLIIAFSVDWKMFACLRFFIGLTLGGIFSCCLLYPIEFVGKWWRGLLTAMPVWNIGATSFSLAVLLLKNWKHVHIATALFSFLVFLLGFWVPESMRWLAVHGKVERAKNIANMVAAMNHRPPPNTAELEVFAKEQRKKMRAKGARYERVVDLFKTDKYFTISAKMGLVWGCLSLLYYTISFGMKFLTGNFYVNFIIFSAAEIPGVIFVGYVYRKLGARLGGLIYFVLIFGACLGLVIANFVAPDDKKDIIVYVLALIAKSNILAAWTIMTALSSEHYPPEVIGISTDFLNGCARVGAVIAPFLIPNIVGSLFVMFLILAIYLFFCCWILVSFPVTKKDTVEDDQLPKSHLSIILEETELEVRDSECEQD